MEFIKTIKVNKDRIGVIIGKNGEEKKFIENTFKVKLQIDSELNEVKIMATDVNSDPFTASIYIEALGRGFSPERASDLLKEGYTMVVINLRDYASTRNSLIRIRSRIIGTNGSARKRLEQLTDTKISVYGDHIAIIGKPDDVKIAADAVMDLIKGARHVSVFNKLQRIRTILKKDRLKLWENET